MSQRARPARSEEGPTRELGPVERLRPDLESEASRDRELADIDEPGEAPPPRKRVSRLTVFLALTAGAALFFLAGVQVQKLFGEEGEALIPPGAAAPGDSGAEATGRAAGGDVSGVTRGEVVAIRGQVLYVREADGATVKVRTTPQSRVARGRPVPAGDLRPGDSVVAESAPRSGAEVTARSVTVVPPRSSENGGG